MSRWQSLLGLDGDRAVRILEASGVEYKVSRCDCPGPQGYPMDSEPRVLWVDREVGGRVILYLAPPQGESEDVLAAKERHFGHQGDARPD